MGESRSLAPLPFLLRTRTRGILNQPLCQMDQIFRLGANFMFSLTNSFLEVGIYEATRQSRSCELNPTKHLIHHDKDSFIQGGHDLRGLQRCCDKNSDQDRRY